MAENLVIPETALRKDIYGALLPQIEALVGPEQNKYANLANISAALKQAFGFFWVGFYLVDSDNELVLGPFQGPIACTRIRKGKGVCGTSWSTAETILVPDVELFPGHIACSADSKSEIVVPVFDRAGNVAMVLDVDSSNLEDFSPVDQEYLEKLASFITTLL
ncbi:MAG: GAF domain-containing protein [Bacteroidota bacterium]